MLFEQKKISACVGVLFGSVLINAQAQIAQPPDYGQKIGDVVVSATRSGTELKDMTQNTSILTNEDIQNAPEMTVDQVLKNQASVFLNDQPYYEKDPTGQSLNVRGLGAARTLALIDGLPANDAMYGTIQWNLVPLSAVQDVELVRGGVSNLYGNYGMGGLINITTKPINDNKGEVSASYGSYNTSNVAASKEVAVNDVLKLRVSADYFNTDGYINQPTISPATVYPVKNKVGQSAPLLPGMGPESANSTNYRLQGALKLSSDADAFFNLGSHNMQNLPTGGYNFATKTTQETTFSGGATTRLSAAQKVQVNAFYENTTLWQQNVSNSGATPAYISANYNDPYSTLGASAQYTHDLKDQTINQVVVSIDGRQVAAQNLTNTFSSAAGYANGVVTSSDYAKGQQQFYGVMAQMKAKTDVIPLQATLSLREDLWQSQTPTYWIAGANGVQNYTNVPNQTAYKFSPNLGLLLQATKEWDFRGAAYQGFHAPGLNNTLRTYGNSTSVSLANPLLSPENMTGYELGTDYRWNAGFVQITGFNANVKNAVYAPNVSQVQAAAAGCPISVCTGANGQTYSLYGNNQNLQSRGLEVQAHHDLNAQWAVDGTYTHTNTILTWIGSGVNASLNPIGSQVGGVPQNMGYAGVTYMPLPKTSLTANIRYIGNSWLDGAHTLPVPSYAVVGLKVNHQLTPEASVFASVINMFNRSYITYGTGTSQGSYIAGQPQSITVGARIIF
ncbi:TonB-dependent receptor [Polynucleobacter sp. JS-Safj-400b-B2]|uniref:TonB-dependent receptor n=1 Tax=Polynucleobacter sp. JS-Safj-400b-B2 TaxID=2576921 RepID=UPI001C0C80B9|nr:TonB-dependent receptor [Polynucleobacter sp. JS-Safj-400b-B2]MBU3626099.1 TonB-dependent receptor [Polynucleobacter sp. JS-Safj-400b-B2]